MITIYQADTTLLQQENKWRILLKELPVSMHERALRYRFKQDAANYVLGRLLLKKALIALGMEEQLEKICFRENGKPYIDGVHFNISHSDNLVVCAISTDVELGIDVEKEKAVKLSDFKAWFTAKEWAIIKGDPHPLKTFYRYWTRKESIIKALGITLSALHQIELNAGQDVFTDNGKSWYLKDLDFGPGFFGAICSERKVRGIRVKKVYL